MKESVYTIILTSVVISSIVSSIIGGIFIYLNERSKRLSEEKRVKLEIASKLTELHDKKVVELLNKSGKVFWRNHAKTYKGYYDYICKIWDGKPIDEDFDSPVK